MNATGERKKRAYLQFLAWAQDYSPEWHAAIVERFPPDIVPPAGALAQLGETWDMLGQIDPFGGVGVPTTTANGNGFNWEVTLNKAFDFATKAVPAYFAYETQRDIADINLERAKQGLPPLDPAVTATQIRVVGDVSPEIQRTIRDFKTGGVNILLWGGLALGGFFLIRAMR